MTNENTPISSKRDLADSHWADQYRYNGGLTVCMISSYSIQPLSDLDPEKKLVEKSVQFRESGGMLVSSQLCVVVHYLA